MAESPNPGTPTEVTLDCTTAYVGEAWDASYDDGVGSSTWDDYVTETWNDMDNSGIIINLS